MTTLLYAKYSRERRPALQIETLIVEEAGRRRVEKRALAPEGAEHLSAIQRSHADWPSGGRLRAVACERVGERIVFPFVEGESLDARLLRPLLAGDLPALLAEVSAYRDLLLPLASAEPAPFDPAPGFADVFGEPAERPAVRTLPGVLDLILDNLIADRDGIVWLIDAEWVFPFPVPLDHVLHRALDLWAWKYREEATGVVTLDELLAAAGVDPATGPLWKRLEGKFQQWVYGDGPHRFLSRYVKPQIEPEALLVERDELHARVAQLVGALAEREREIASFGSQLEAARKTAAEREGEIERALAELERRTVGLEERAALLARLLETPGLTGLVAYIQARAAWKVR